jgi:hypothetical protein
MTPPNDPTKQTPPNNPPNNPQKQTPPKQEKTKVQ